MMLTGLINTGWTQTCSGLLDSAHDHLRRALELSRRIGVREGEARTLHFLADCLRRQGKYREALDLFRSALVLAREIRNQDIESHALNVLGQVHHGMGALAASKDCYDHVLRLTTRTGQNFKAVPAHDGLGKIAVLHGDHVSALMHWEKALAIATAAGLPEAADIRRRLTDLQQTKL